MKKLLLNSILLLCALVVGTSAWAETVTLSSAQIKAGSGSTSYGACSATDGGGNTWNAYAIKNQHSKATSDYNFWQIKAYASATAYYVQVPELGTKITSITITVSGSNQARGNGGNSATLYFSASNSTSATGTGVASGTGSSSVTIDCSSLNLNTGYITASGAVRIWDVQVTYSNTAATKVSTPSISGDENFLNSTEVSISCGTDGAAIQYSTDNGNNWNNYSAPFSITETTTVKAKATKSGLTDSDEASETFTKVTPMTVAEARGAIDAGTGTTGVYVRGIVCEGGSAFSGGAMNYWISDDGTSTDKFEVYKGKGLNGANFTSTDDIKVGDIVIVTGDIKKYESTYEFSSGSQLFVHIPKVNTPSFSPSAGAVAANTEVSISTTTEGATIYYTVDGSAPTTISSVYSTPIIIDAAKTIKAFAVKAGFPDSDIATAAYTIAEPCATPTFSLAAGEVEKGSTVEISCSTDGATIYYTIDGTEPTTGSTEYTSAITINSATTIKAIAAKDGLANSAVATASYTVRDYVTLPFAFDEGKDDLPSGLTQSGLGSDYGSSPKLKFDSSGDYLILKINEVPGTLTFDIKGNSFSGGTFKVQTSSDASAYTDLASYTTLGDKEPQSYKLSADVRYIKWIYTNKSSGNVALGNINLLPVPDEPTTPTVDDVAHTVTLTTTANMAGWRTFAPVKDDQNYTVDGTTKVYYASATADGKVTLTEIADGVPANTPVILHQTSGTTITLTETATSISAPGSNLLQVSSANDNLGTVYRLGYKSAYGVGFYTYTTNSAPAGIIYLSSVSTARDYLEFTFDDETTGIDDVRNKMSDGRSEYFNLAGQRVAQPTKGLYIVNGRKVVIK